MPDTNTFEAPGELITVVQLPIITERLSQLKAHWEQAVADAESMVATEETLRQIKTMRADMRKEFAEIESARKAVKKSVLGPYEKFEAVYKECVSFPFHRADDALSHKSGLIEKEFKDRCEDGLREYFSELCAVHHLEWLKFEQSRIEIDMASAKAKTPNKLRKQLAEFVVKVNDGVNLIDGMEGSEEIMVEFHRSLDAAQAIQTVLERRRRVDEERAEKEARKAAQAQETEMVRRVEALAPPIHVLHPEESEEDAAMCDYIDHLMQKQTIKVSLTLHPTKLQYEEKIKPILVQLKEICDMEGIQYE